MLQDKEATELPLQKDGQVGDDPGVNRLTIVVLKDTVLIDNVGSNELDVLGYICLRRANSGYTHLKILLISTLFRYGNLQVVEQALGEGRVWVEINQVWSFLWLEEPNSVAVLLDCHPHLGKHRLPEGSRLKQGVQCPASFTFADEWSRPCGPSPPRSQ